MTTWCRFLCVCVVLPLAEASVAAGERTEEAVSPRGQVIRLFNGKDLSGFYTWLKDSGRQDPKKIFSVEDGMIHVTGEGLGYLATEKPYKDYHLSVEYKWGKRTDGSKYVRNSGVLLHGIGPDGAANGAWMTCVECQLAQGCEGDLIVIRGKDAAGKVVPATITCEVQLGPDKKPRWKPGGTRTVYSGQQFWWSKHEPFFEELRDTRGKADVASPLGQWTKVECICRGGRITIKINGSAVNECFDAYPAAGKIMLQNEGNEVYFRNVELRPLEMMKDGG
jgi:hypothetical protein